MRRYQGDNPFTIRTLRSSISGERVSLCGVSELFASWCLSQCLRWRRRSPASFHRFPVGVHDKLVRLVVLQQEHVERKQLLRERVANRTGENGEIIKFFFFDSKLNFGFFFQTPLLQQYPLLFLYSLLVLSFLEWVCIEIKKRWPNNNKNNSKYWYCNCICIVLIVFRELLFIMCLLRVVKWSWSPSVLSWFNLERMEKSITLALAPKLFTQVCATKRFCLLVLIVFLRTSTWSSKRRCNASYQFIDYICTTFAWCEQGLFCGFSYFCYLYDAGWLTNDCDRGMSTLELETLLAINTKRMWLH